MGLACDADRCVAVVHLSAYEEYLADKKKRLRKKERGLKRETKALKDVRLPCVLAVPCASVR